MKNTVPSYFKNFSCVADKCPDTCCAGWEVVVDKESLEKYRTVQSGYGEKIRSLLTVDSDGDTIYKSNGGKCPFLLENGLCDMYIEIGHENLCRTCRLFPRHITDFGSRLETGLSFSCPEAARLITENDTPITFETEEIDGEISPNSIDPNVYFTLLKARNLAIDILQNRNFSVPARLCNFLDFCVKTDKLINKKDFTQTLAFIESRSFSESVYTTRPVAAKKTLKKLFSDLQTLERLNKDWDGYSEKMLLVSPAGLSDFLCTTRKNEWELEHFAVYLVFRYFMTAVFDGDLLSKAKFTVFSLLAVCSVQAEINATEKEARINVMQKYSKEVEHSADNLEKINYLIKKSKYYSTDNLINILELIK